MKTRFWFRKGSRSMSTLFASPSAGEWLLGLLVALGVLVLGASMEDPLPADDTVPAMALHAAVEAERERLRSQMGDHLLAAYQQGKLDAVAELAQGGRGQGVACGWPATQVGQQ